MLFLCDIGNTTIKIGFADAQGLSATYALPTNKEATADSMGLALLALCRQARMEPQDLRGALAASVVPNLDGVIREAIKRYLGLSAAFVPRDMPVPLENHYERPQEVGADRLLGAYAARRHFPGDTSLIVVDYGTAVTFDCIENNAYLGGLIFPGPAAAAAALAERTAKLPAVSLSVEADVPSPGRDTGTSIRHGLVFGYVALTEGLCHKLASRLEKPMKIIATGGFAEAIGRLSPIFDATLPSLVLDGLRLLYFADQGQGLAPRPIL